MNEQQIYHQRSGELLLRGERFVTVTIVAAHGSTPAIAGSRMIVTATGLDFGSVGGGRIEAKAIEVAQRLIQDNESTQFLEWSLKADIGMTCGGSVKLYFEVWNPPRWPIVIFGAGHVTQALAKILDTIVCQVTCIDPRHDWIDKLPTSVRSIVTENPAEQVDKINADSFVLCMTKGHTSDLPVLHRIFSTDRSFPYLGVIGSRAKAAVLRKELIAVGIAADKLQFHCPVGLMDGQSPIGNHHPAEIAISIAAQLLQRRGAD